MRRDPLARAMRPDKATLAAVAATLGLYRAGLARDREIPVWRMIAAPVAERSRARADAPRRRAIGDAVDASSSSRSTVGGGSLPGETLPSVGRRASTGRSPDRLLAALRRGRPAGHRPDRGRPGRARPADGRTRPDDEASPRAIARGARRGLTGR